MTIENWISLISPLIALVALGISLFTLKRTKHLSLNAQTMPVFADFMKQYRESIQPSYYYISNKKSDFEDKFSEFPLSELPDDDRKHAAKVAHFFDNLGLLVSSKIIHEEYVLNFIGQPAFIAWTILKNNIKKERMKRVVNGGDTYYQMHFEYFAQKFIESNFELKNKNFYDSMLSRRSQIDKYPEFTRFKI